MLGLIFVHDGRTDGQKFLGNDGVALLRSTKLSLNQAPSFDEAWTGYVTDIVVESRGTEHIDIDTMTMTMMT